MNPHKTWSRFGTLGANADYQRNPHVWQCKTMIMSLKMQNADSRRVGRCSLPFAFCLHMLCICDAPQICGSSPRKALSGCKCSYCFSVLALLGPIPPHRRTQRFLLFLVQQTKMLFFTLSLDLRRCHLTSYLITVVLPCGHVIESPTLLPQLSPPST